MIERSEAWVRELGFRVFRVRHLAGEGAPRAKVQIAPEEMAGLAPVQGQLEAGILAAGYSAVEIDPAGYRSAT